MLFMELSIVFLLIILFWEHTRASPSNQPSETTRATTPLDEPTAHAEQTAPRHATEPPKQRETGNTKTEQRPPAPPTSKRETQAQQEPKQQKAAARNRKRNRTRQRTKRQQTRQKTARNRTKQQHLPTTRLHLFLNRGGQCQPRRHAKPAKNAVGTILPEQSTVEPYSVE
jgi:outer membrane biosynthesis protein TonB